MDNVYPLFYPEEEPFAGRQYSYVLMYHIGLSEEINENPISAEEMAEIDKTLLATSHMSYKHLQLLKRWPTYETDEYYRQWASQDVPILMLNGTLDQKTSIAISSIARDNLTGPNQYFIPVPNGNHYLTWDGSPVKNIFAPDCGTQIILDYMEDPLEEPDTSCLTNLMQINFRGNPLMALALFGTWNLWENGINTSQPDDQISLMEEEVEKISHDLRQRRPRLR
jgi:hypothetical protein